MFWCRFLLIGCGVHEHWFHLIIDSFYVHSLLWPSHTEHDFLDEDYWNLIKFYTLILSSTLWLHQSLKSIQKKKLITCVLRLRRILRWCLQTCGWKSHATQKLCTTRVMVKPMTSNTKYMYDHGIYYGIFSTNDVVVSHEGQNTQSIVS